MYTPEGLVSGPCAGEEVGEVGDVVRADAPLQEVEITVPNLVGLAGGGRAELAGQDHAALLRTLRVGEAPGIGGMGPHYGQQIFAEHLLASSASDRKSTRLNSSHANISYAVFCLKKKKQEPMSVYTVSTLTCNN